MRYSGLLVWGLLWLAWGDGWSWNGKWFKPAVVVVIAWSSGQLLQRLTTLPPLLAAILTGILARNLGYLDMRGYPHVDNFLRYIRNNFSLLVKFIKGDNVFIYYYGLANE